MTRTSSLGLSTCDVNTRTQWRPKSMMARWLVMLSLMFRYCEASLGLVSKYGDQMLQHRAVSQHGPTTGRDNECNKQIENITFSWAS